MIKRFFQRYWAECLVGAVAIAIYARTLRGDFLRWDDRQNILLNPWIENNILSLIWTRSYYNMYIPVTYTFWTGLWHIDPNNPLQFHLANVLLHALNSVLVYILARLLFRPHEKSAALIAALVFASHPLQVETVAWISTGRDLLAGLFSLSGAYLLLTRTSWSAMALTFVLFTISCLCKPSVAVMPVAIGFIAYAVNLLTPRRTWALATWLVPGLIVTILTKRIQQLDADLRLVPLDLIDRVLVAVDTQLFYIIKFVAPYPLSADYGRTPQIALDGDLWIWGLVLLAVLGAGVSAFRRHVSCRPLYFAALVVLLFSPVLGIVPFQAQAQSTISDRYCYFPMIAGGLLVGLALSKTWWLERIVAPSVVCILMGMTFVRAGVWETNEGFFKDMLEKNQNSHVALSSLGVEYILTNRFAEAEQVLNRATQLRPMDVIPRTNLAQLYLIYNRPDRVVNEITPLLYDKEFLRINQTETRALASVYRLTARAHWGMDLWTRANEFYCRWFGLDYENEDGKRELQRFLEDARRHQARLPNCELRPQ